MNRSATNKRIYLDYAAATPLDERVATAMMDVATTFANPGASYSEGRAAREAYELAKKQVGMVLGARASEMVFTSGATESDNLAILGAVRPFLSAGQKTRPHIVTIATEHKSVLEPIRQLEREGARVSFVEVDHSGGADLANLENQIGESTVLVSIAYASSEIGTIQPMNKIGQLISKIKKSRVERGSGLSPTPLLLHSDCSAVVGLLPLSPARLSLDLLSLNASKFYGPHGSGILFVKTGTALSPLMYGGGQQNGIRPGSEDIVAAVGCATALEIAESMRVAETQRLSQMRDQLMLGLKAISPDIIMNGAVKHRLSNNVNVTIPDGKLDGEDMVARFDAAGIAVATGAACAANSEAPSHVLLAIGRSKIQAQNSLRITLGQQTTFAEVEQFLVAAKQIIGE